MPRFRLRYQSTNLEMPLGDFTIGRSSSCNLAVADSLVSRRHALLRVTEDVVTVSDLGSRNGVSVNGMRIDSEYALKHMDRVYIGSQELVLLDADKFNEGASDTSGYKTCDTCGNVNGSAKRRCSECGSLLSGASTRTFSGDAPSRSPSSASPQVDETRTATALEVIGTIAKKSIALGRFEEAARILKPHFDGLEQGAKSGRTIEPDTLRNATDYSLRLCSATSESIWIDWIFRLHAASQRLLDATTVDQLHDLVRRTKYRNVALLRQYLEVVRRRSADFSAADRFVLRRIEGLEQVLLA